MSESIENTIYRLSHSIQVPIKKRKAELIGLQSLINENKSILLDALFNDLHKPEAEGFMTELAIVLNGIDDALLTIDGYMAEEKVDLGKWKMLLNISGSVRHLPLGLVLIIGAWNYPVQLTLLPLVGAIAGGNRVILKPSEISSHTSMVLANLIPKYLDSEIVAVVQGGIPETTALINSPKLDLIFFTGSTSVGKIVYEAASKNLVPVVLELGGKSPTVVDRDVDLRAVARRIIFGKLMNLGQTCIAPDYIVVIGDGTAREQVLVLEMKKAAKEFYQLEDLKDLSKASIPRIITQTHVKRLSSLVEGAKKLDDGTLVDQTGSINLEDKIFPLTFITGLTRSNFKNHPAMKEEIFGPVLPIITVSSATQAVELIKKVDSSPLTEYVFSSDNCVIEELSQINAGNLVINDTMLNGAIEYLPFGGVGMSGMGAYHGKYSLEAFTRKQSVLRRSIGWEFLNYLRYPNVAGNVESMAFKLFTGILVSTRPPSWIRLSIERCRRYIKYLAAFAVGVTFGLIAKQ